MKRTKTVNIRLYNDTEMSDYTDRYIEDVRAQSVEKDIYKIASIPMQVNGFNLGDIVRARYTEIFDSIVFQSTLLKSEDVLLRTHYDLRRECRKYLKKSGCSIKNHNTISIHVPKCVFSWVNEYLEDQQCDCEIVSTMKAG